MNSNNRKVSIILLRSGVFVVLVYLVGQVSIKLPRSGSGHKQILSNQIFRKNIARTNVVFSKLSTLKVDPGKLPLKFWSDLMSTS